MTLIPLTVAVPLLVAALLAACTKFIPRLLADLLALLTAAALTIAGVYITRTAATVGTQVYWFGGWHPRPGDVSVGIAFVVDPVAGSLVTFIGFLGTAALAFSWKYFESAGALYHSLMLIFLGAMAGFCLSGDLFTMFVFFELMGTCAFALTAHKIESDSLEGALNFGIINSLGAFLTLWGIALLYGTLGALNLSQLGLALAGSHVRTGLAALAFALIACGFLVKAAIAPFHFWLADAHAVAPTPVCLLFSGIMVELGLYGVARVYWTVFANAHVFPFDRLRVGLAALGVITAIIGAVMCATQRHLKRLLAFSTISHSGIMLTGLMTADPVQLGGALLYIFSHGLVKGGLFLGTGIVLARFHTEDVQALRGRGRELPWTAALFIIGAFGLAGLPPFGTYLAKALIDSGLHATGQSTVTYILLLAAGITGGAVLRASGIVFFGWGKADAGTKNAPTNQERPETRGGQRYISVSMTATATILIFLSLALGVWPRLTAWTHAAAERFLDVKDYNAAVFAVTSGPLSRQPQFAETFHAGPLLSGLAAAVIAVAFAAIALFPQVLPARVPRGAERMSHPVIAGLQTLHRGSACDYAAWLTAGMAILGLLFTVANS